MGRPTIDPLPLLLSPALFMISACGGSGGGAPPPEPIPPGVMEARLSSGEQTVDALFATDEVLDLVLAADFDRLRGDRGQESEEYPAQVLVRGPGGEAVEVPVQVKTRGNFRLQRRTCPDFPPLRLNFPETRPQGTVFDGQDKIKLVTHCRNSDRYEQNLLEEYMVYRIYNQLTDLSFQVQLARITYLDLRGEDDPVQRMAFLLEDEDAMATRVGGKMVEVTRANPGDFVQDHLILMYLFAYMVGNVDWGTGVGHNVKVMNKDFGYYPVPYDFDWTGFVNAPYAGPNELTDDLHDSVRERVYWGACLPGIDYATLYAHFNETREAVYGLPWNEVGLSEGNVESALEYLEEFYEIINDPDRAERAIERSCRRM